MGFTPPPSCFLEVGVEPVQILSTMKIYTKQGDAGETGLYGGERVPKDHLRIQAYGTLDELNAALGLALAPFPDVGLDAKLAERLRRIQAELFQLGAELATPSGKKISTAVVSLNEVTQMEVEIDEMEKSLPKLMSFILPGGSHLAAQLHVARTVCRRAERELVVLNRAEPLRPVVMQYVNRLSDYLFVSSRFANYLEKIADIPWNAP